MSSKLFTKLFKSILRSTLWVQNPMHVKVTWVAMLAMADQEGIVWSSIPGLAKEAGVSIEEAEEALKVFLSPDKYSRTPDHEGRRIEVVKGGWRLLNYETKRKEFDDDLYREQKRDYMRRHRESQKVGHGEQHVPESGNVDSLSLSPSESRSDPDPDSEQGPCLPEVPGLKRVAGPRWAPTRFVPDDWMPNDAHSVRCQELRFDIDTLVRDFRAHEFNRDYSDWDRRFSKWIEEERVKRETAAADALRRGKPGLPGTDDPLAGWSPTRGRTLCAKHGLDFGREENAFRRSSAFKACRTHAEADDAWKGHLGLRARASQEESTV